MWQRTAVVYEVGLKMRATSERGLQRTAVEQIGTCKTIQARFWPWISGASPRNLSRCPLFAREHYIDVGCGFVEGSERENS